MMGEEIEEIRKRKMKEMLDKMKYPDRSIELKDGNFNETIKKYPVVLVDFWSERCPPCRLIAPVIEELAGELKGKVVFGKLDVDRNISTAMRFGIMAIPTLMIFKKGELVDRIMGAVPKEQILEKLKRYLD
jgi:thioredoxin 1